MAAQLMGELPRSRREPRAKLCLKNWKSTSVAQADFRQNVHTVRYCWMVGKPEVMLRSGLLGQLPHRRDSGGIPRGASMHQPALWCKANTVHQ